MDPKLHIAHQDEASFIGHYGNVLLGISSGKSSYSHLDLSYELHCKLRRDYPGGFAKLVISAGGAKMPSAEERVAIHRLATDFARNTLAIALVFEGDGLWLSSMRMVTRAMMLAIAKPFPQSIFANVPESVHWLASRCGSEAHFNASGLITAVASMR
jgi:hypothetical protein